MQPRADELDIADRAQGSHLREHGFRLVVRVVHGGVEPRAVEIGLVERRLFAASERRGVTKIGPQSLLDVRKKMPGELATLLNAPFEPASTAEVEIVSLSRSGLAASRLAMVSTCSSFLPPEDGAAVCRSRSPCTRQSAPTQAFSVS